MAAMPAEPMAAPDPLLELERVDAGYAAFRALFGVSLVVPEDAPRCDAGGPRGAESE